MFRFSVFNELGHSLSLGGAGRRGLVTFLVLLTGRGVNQTLEPSEVQQTVLTARRFTAGSLPSIPEHRVAGRRLAVKQVGSIGHVASNRRMS